jgi:hypothetical protein
MQLSMDELNILCTALSQLTNSRLCRVKNGRYRFTCADGRRRSMTEAELLNLMDRLTLEAGHKPVSEDALEMAKEVGLR